MCFQKSRLFLIVMNMVMGLRRWNILLISCFLVFFFSLLLSVGLRPVRLLLDLDDLL